MSMRMNYATLVIAALLLCVTLPARAVAQAQATLPAAQTPEAVAAEEARKKALSPQQLAAEEAHLKQEAERAAKEAAEKKNAEIAERPPFRDSLLFTDLEVDTILKAATGRAVQSTVGIESIELIPVDRKIWVSGIYYKNPQVWIVWMNGYKLTPGYLLPEIRGIKVEQDRVHLEWYDIGKNGIINITMQPHQVYDIVTGILVWDTDGGAPPSSGVGRGARR